MKINEVEASVGITKKNIRFYEEEGLLHPRRNSENGYREYGDADVARLARIKLLRKLDVPLAEIKAMLEGKLPLAEGMHRHAITLAHRQNSIEEAQQFCAALSSETGLLDALDAQAMLTQLATKEEQGVCFVNVEKQDKKKARKHNALWGAGLFIAFLLPQAALLLWLFALEGLSEIPAPIYIYCGLFIALPIIGVVAALVQRMRQIQKGEEHDYSDY